MRNHAFLKVVLLGLLTFALVPGIAGAASQGQDLAGILSSGAAERATAVSGPVIDVSPASLNFGTVTAGGCGSLTVTITNGGDMDLNIFAISAFAPFSTAAGAMTLMPGEMADVVVDYCPTDGSSALDYLSIESDALNGATFNVLLEGRGNTAPYFNPPLAGNSYGLFAFVPFSLTASATDPEGDVLAWSIADQPPGSLWDGTSGTLTWTPLASAAGSYTPTICITDGYLGACATFTLNVGVTNAQPVADAGGNYFGFKTIPVHFNGSASFDPDGDALTYEWNFGDGPGTGSGVAVDHTYAAVGSYVVSLTVTDNGVPPLSNTAYANADIADFLSVDVTAKLTSGAIKTFGQALQPIGAEVSPVSGFSVLDLDPATVKLSTDYPGAGTVSEILPDLVKGKVLIGDLDTDRLKELVVNFTRENIGLLLGNVPNGTVVNLILDGTTTAATGSNPWHGSTPYKIKTNGGPAAVSSFAAPNPFNPETSISYTLRNQGSVSVRIYSVNGQLVRSLRDEFANPGTYEVRWNGTDDSGRPVRSGIYFVNVVQGANSSQNKVVVAK